MKTREILFRGLRTDGQGWVYGDLHQWKGKTNILPHQGREWAKPNNFEVKPESVGQFTGLLDKNGTKIFEGDMFTHYYYGLCVVIFNGGSFKAQSKKQNKTVGFGSWSKQILVVGNIHEQ